MSQPLSHQQSAPGVEAPAQCSPRYYVIGGMTIAVSAEAPFTDATFGDKFAAFRGEHPGDDLVCLRHHFHLPEPASVPVGQVYFREQPWEIQQTAEGWVYRCILPASGDLMLLGRFSPDYAVGDVFHRSDRYFHGGQWHSLTGFPTDQVLIGSLLVARQGCMIHSGGMVIDGQGVLFVGHSDAGKSTTVTMLREMGTILCDDRNIIRRHSDGFHVYGTWSHGTVADVSSAHAPLRAICFLEQSPHNAAIPLTDRRDVVHRLLLTLIKPLVTADWVDQTFALLEQLVHDVPAYRLQLDTSGAVRDTMAQVLRG